MDSEGGEGGPWYCLISRVMEARPMALRVIQPTPWRARAPSVLTERVLFYKGGHLVSATYGP